jgi:hypothetical protein
MCSVAGAASVLYCRITCTLATAAVYVQGAVTVARRVAEERRVELGSEVGYAVRFENRTSSSTKIKYLTGVHAGAVLQQDVGVARHALEAHQA